jgi:hypothetical protein
MPPRQVRAFAVALVLFAGAVAARADDLADFNAAVEQAQSHSRAAIGDLSTGNLDRALFEIDRLREAWTVFEQRFAGKRPAAFDSVPRYTTVFTDIKMRLIAADLMIKMGKPDAVRQSLEAIGGDLYNLRKAAGISVLADCVRDAKSALNALTIYDDRAVDWSSAATRSAIAGKSAAYGAVLERCDGIAGDAMRKNPDFRGLIDGAKTSLALIPKAIAAHDGDLLHRALIELRAFDKLLAFHYG